MAATLIQMLIFMSYIALIVKKFGVMPSISESWYALEEEENPLFTVFCWGIGLPMFFQSNGTSELFMLSGVGLSLVGTAVRFKSMHSYKLHYAGAAAGIGGALLGLWRENGLWQPLAAFAILFTTIFLVKKIVEKIWWIEISAFITIVIGLMSR
jgi:hypothetical protein